MMHIGYVKSNSNRTCKLEMYSRICTLNFHNSSNRSASSTTVLNPTSTGQLSQKKLLVQQMKMHIDITQFASSPLSLVPLSTVVWSSSMASLSAFSWVEVSLSQTPPKAPSLTPHMPMLPPKPSSMPLMFPSKLPQMSLVFPPKPPPMPLMLPPKWPLIPPV